MMAACHREVHYRNTDSKQCTCQRGLGGAPDSALVSAAVCESLDAPNCTAKPPAVPCAACATRQARECLARGADRSPILPSRCQLRHHHPVYLVRPGEVVGCLPLRITASHMRLEGQVHHAAAVAGIDDAVQLDALQVQPRRPFRGSSSHAACTMLASMPLMAALSCSPSCAPAPALCCQAASPLAPPTVGSGLMRQRLSSSSTISPAWRKSIGHSVSFMPSVSSPL